MLGCCALLRWHQVGSAPGMLRGFFSRGRPALARRLLLLLLLLLGRSRLPLRQRLAAGAATATAAAAASGCLGKGCGGG